MDGQPIIRDMSSDDLDDIMEVELKSFSIPWTREMFRGELFNPRAVCLVIEVSGQVIGYAGLWSILDEGHITNVAIHPDFRRRGYGKRLIEMLLDKAARLGLSSFTLEVRVSNISAITLYESFGFTSSGVRKGYYVDNNEDAIIMWLRLKDQKHGA